MRRIISLIAIFLLSLSSVMGQMIPINLPADGNWPTIVGDSIMIIGPRQNELTEEQRYFNPVYLMTYPGKEHLKAQMIRAGACDCDPTKPNRRIGVFSVAPDKQVSFSQGNLQYLPAINLWKFANTQYEYLGNANKYLKPTFRNWVDLFGWSANNTTAPFGVSTSTNAADYAGDFVDWGTNTICGDAPGTWRTLSVDEWGYLFQGRKNADQLLALATLEGVQGLVLLPDNWQQPEDIPFVSSVEQGLAWDATRLEGSYFDATNKDHTKDNIYTQAQWQKMEALGAVFLPCAGWRQEKTWTHAGIVEVNIKYLGSYWSCSTPQISNDYYLFRFTQQEIRKFPLNNSLSLLARGRSVRLVHDTIVPKPEPEYVDLGLSVKWATFNVGASKPEDYGDYFAWGETEPKETYSWATYKWCNGTQNTITKYNTADGKTILEPADDAAQVNWGGKWRMPTKEECQELLDKCTWKEETRNGINGHIVTGPNGNSIFIPTTGYHNDDNGTGVQGLGTITYLWTSSTPGNANAYDLLLSHPTLADGIGSNTRRVGMPIRPVYDDRPPKRIGVFSVGADKQVSFSQGNLQYIQSTKEWLFAENQWDFIGEKNIYSGVIADKIDFFGWSTNNPQSLWGLIFTQSNVYYSGTFVDWGNNLIMGDLANTWRTLSLNEWTYLLRQRENANNLYTYANINGTNGLVLLPDKWEAIDEIPISIATDYSANTFSFSQWETLEAKGAVFLPSCGVYMGNNYNHETAGLYWTNTPDESDETKSHCLYVTKRYVDINYSGNRSTNRSVRLVHDTIVPKPEPEYVDLGLSVKWATFNVGATSPNEIGNFYAWGEIEPKDTYTVNNYKWWNKTSKETTKYCTIDSLAYGGVADGLTELQPQDDIAHILKGKHWRMPDLDECKELGNGCTWTVSTRQGQIGFEGISKINGNTIFLPVVGFRAGANLVHETIGGYWSSTLNIEKQSCAMGLYLNLETPSVGIYYNSSRQNGFLIRPVYDEVPDPCLVVKVNDTLSINMMCVEAGTFTMGDGEDAHPVSLSNYSIGQTEVTQALWQAVMGTTPSANTANKQLPVTNISWYDCQEFIKKLNQQTGMRFRLPTEAEWEYAARGGQRSKGYAYAGSNDIKEVAWYNGNSGNTLHAVGQKKPNELGIYDMSGNVWEWCHDWHAPYPTTHQYNPLGPEVGQIVGKRYLRVFRGGSYGYEAAYHQNAFRDITGPEPNIGTANLGLRLVLSDDVNFETVHVNDTLSFHMMNVNGDTFTMGDDNISNASPAHQVTLSDYYIGQTEVTQTLWKAVMGNVPTGNKNPSYPVGYVSYADCQDFIARLNNLTGLHFQLPTEAEWEYAAMGGNKSHNYIYSGSNTIDDVAWYDQNSENKLHHVGTKQPNELGIYDMSGNAWEWCADYHGKYTAENQINPQGPTTGTGRVIRSGSFRTTADRCTNKHRQAREADYPDSHITLRLVLHDTVPVSPEPEYVDLGLSVKWATFNVGATSPEDDGDYFAWGETETKETYSWASYKWGTSSNLTKYNATDGKTILEPADDAAQVHWGGNWRMPSKEEVDELTQQCNWIWTTHNNVNGYKVTGPNGNSIFLPAAGYRGSGPTYPAGEDGLYWTNTLEKRHYSYLIVLHDDAPPTQAGSSGTRCFGFTIRPVYDDRP